MPDRTPRPTPEHVARATADVDAEIAETDVRLADHERQALIDERARLLAAADTDSPRR